MICHRETLSHMDSAHAACSTSVLMMMLTLSCDTAGSIGTGSEHNFLSDHVLETYYNYFHKLCYLQKQNAHPICDI